MSCNGHCRTHGKKSVSRMRGNRHNIQELSILQNRIPTAGMSWQLAIVEEFCSR
jgi:hypothetical protein